ncbi:restriction endonuclease subunit S [Pseudomonas sp. NPDC090201]|uniref:restriction endonuclease subunit S n=1 Tax=Pseudomonas sp. NPDC090201 TaxID=3364475 RepID=UPI003807ECC5
MSEQVKMLVPELRFPDFDGSVEWVRAELGTMGKLVSGLTYTPEDVRHNGLLVLRSSNVQSGQISLNDNVFVRPDIRGANLCRAGDILICVRNGSKPLIGKSALISNDTPMCTPGAFMTVFRADFPEFVFQLLQTHAYQVQVAADLGATINSINGKQLKKYEFLIPYSNLEQKKIADFLGSIDALVILHSQKLEALKHYRKGMMQQLFPVEGEVVPRLRFPEFRNSEPWKLKPMGKVLGEKQRRISMEDDAEYSLVTVKRRYGGLISRGVFRGRSIKVKSQFKVYENDFLISKRQIVHCACGVVPKELDGSIVSNEYSVLVPKKDNCVHFLEYFAQQPAVSLSFVRCSIGIVIEKMLFKLNDWFKEEFLFPEFDEQRKIAQFFSELDRVIDQQLQKVESLKEYKKGLMQKLFPVMDEVSDEQ